MIYLHRLRPDDLFDVIITLIIIIIIFIIRAGAVNHR
jgi:hypothetical protein